MSACFEGEIPEGVLEPQENAPVWKPGNLSLCKQLSFNFLAFFLFCKGKKLNGNMEEYNIGELPRHRALGFFCWETSLKIHIEIKRELFTFRFMTMFT
jgi:hypothetical protein